MPLRGISQPAVVHHLGTGSQRRWRRSVRAHDVLHRDVPNQQVVGDDAPVTPPPHRFSTHDGAAMLASQPKELIKPRPKRGGLRIVSVVAEGCDTPECVGRGRCVPAMVTSAPKGGQMSVTHAVGRERLGEGVALELRIGMRARDRSHVGDQLHVELSEQRHEVGRRSRRVADGEDGPVQTAIPGGPEAGRRRTISARRRWSDRSRAPRPRRRCPPGCGRSNHPSGGPRRWRRSHRRQRHERSRSQVRLSGYEG